MARGNVGSRIAGLMLLAVILAALQQEGGLKRWLLAKAVNRPQ